MGCPFFERTLTSGLPVLVLPQPHLSRAHVGLWVRVGSRYESRTTNGLSHFLEHMLYRGTPRLPRAHDVNLAFESLGGYLHAATHADHGVFSVTLPEESLGEATLLFGEVITAPTFRDIDVEKRIVEEEILEDLDEDGREIDPDNLSRGQIFQDHPLGWTITGDLDAVRSFDIGMLRAHHARHYVARNSVLAFSGRVDPERAFEAAERAFSGMPSGSRVVPDAPSGGQDGARFLFVENAGSQTDLRIGFTAFSDTSEHAPAIDVLMRVVDDGMSTRLYHRVCDDQGLCYDVSAAYDGYEDAGVVDFAAGCVHERTAEITREILAMMKDLGASGPTPDELEKARRRSAWDARAMGDSPEELAGFFARGRLLGRFETPDERIARNARVGREDVARVARLVARPERLNVVAVGLLDEREEARLEAVVNAFRPARDAG